MSETVSPFIQAEPSSSTTSSTSPTYHQHHHRKPSVVLTCIIVLSLVTNGVLFCMVALNWRPWISDYDPRKDNPTSGSQSGGSDAINLCFSCEYLGPGIESNDTIYDVIRFSPSNTLCCLRQKNHVTKLFQKIISDVYKHPHQAMPPKSTNFGQHDALRPVGAHLYMKPQGASPPLWTTDDPYSTAFCSGVECREGTITIKEEGTYLVYSHLAVHSYNGLHSHKNLLHEILRTNPNLSALGEKSLLFSKTSPITSPQKTSFLSAILRLRRQDILRVTVSKDYYHMLDGSLYSNYFGVMKM